MRRLTCAVVTGALLLVAARATADPAVTRIATTTGPLPIVFHVAVERTRRGPRPVTDEAYLDAATARASAILGQAGLSFFRREVRRLPFGRGLHVRNRWARNALARYAGPAPAGAIEVFVVKTLHDLGRSWVKLPGVQWYTYQGPGIARRYVIIGQGAGVETMAHELGHYFGLGHHRSRWNLMRPGPARVAARLTRSQVYYIKARASHLIAQGVLVPGRGRPPAPTPPAVTPLPVEPGGHLNAASEPEAE